MAEVNALSTRLRSVEDLKTGNELIYFSVDKYLNKSEFKIA